MGDLGLERLQLSAAAPPQGTKHTALWDRSALGAWDASGACFLSLCSTSVPHQFLLTCALSALSLLLLSALVTRRCHIHLRTVLKFLVPIYQFTVFNGVSSGYLCWQCSFLIGKVTIMTASGTLECKLLPLWGKSPTYKKMEEKMLSLCIFIMD